MSALTFPPYTPQLPVSRVSRQRASARAAALVALGTIVALLACGMKLTGYPSPVATLYFATSSPGAPADITTIHALDAVRGYPRWQLPVAGKPLPLVFNGATLFLGTEQTSGLAPPSGSSLTAVTAITGDVAWQDDYPSQIVRPIAATANTLFVTLTTSSSTGSPPAESIAALHASDGLPFWSTAMPDTLVGRVIFDGTALYVITHPPNGGIATAPPPFTLTALRARNGKPLWYRTLADPPIVGAYGPALGGGVLYLTEQSPTSSGPGVVRSTIIDAIAVRDGTRLWQTTSPAGTAVVDLLASADGVFYAFTDNSDPGGGLVALHAGAGTVIWQDTSAVVAPRLLEVDSTTVYAQVPVAAGSSLQPALRTYDAHDGTVKYLQLYPVLPVQLPPQPIAPGVIAGNELYLMFQAQQQDQYVVLAMGTRAGAEPGWAQVLNDTPATPLFYFAP